jgi:alanine racemase
MSSPGRWAWAEIDLDALEHNVRLLGEIVAPAAVWAVVKADGYGHGAVAIGERALAAGAEGLCVALVQEGAVLREAGIEAPILVLSEQPVEQLPELLGAGLTPTVYSEEYADAIAAVAEASSSPPVGVHVKIDTGMQRVGVQPDAAAALVAHVRAHAPSLRLDGLFTHLACADSIDAAANADQLGTFEHICATLDAHGISVPALHAANSAGALALPVSRLDLVRAGIAIYGISPGSGVDHLVTHLRPVMSLRARVSYVKRVAAGSHVSYGWRHRFERETNVATVPIGYADGVPRRLGTLPDAPGFDVLIGGRRCPIVGVVTMDQLVVDVGGPDGDQRVEVGDEVVLFGEQGGQRIRAEDWAERLGTIGYEIVCGISGRVSRLARSSSSPPS